MRLKERVRTSPWQPAGGTRSGSYLGVGQHHVLDERPAARLAALHADVVDLVASDLPVLPARRQRAPRHLQGGGVQHLHLHPPRRSAGN